MTPDEVTSRLDLDHIGAAAHWAARSLELSGCARVVLTPGDMTQYVLVVVDRAAPLWQDGAGRLIPTKDYWVVLMTKIGRGYQWHGGEVHPGYAAEKWADGHEWTGTVVATFLNLLSAAIKDLHSGSLLTDD